jgi:hypothetical protein
MTTAINQHIGELMKKSDEAIDRIEQRGTEVTDNLLRMMKANTQPSSPARKQSRGLHDDVEMNSDTDIHMYVPITPANHSSPPQRGLDNVVSERK